MHFECSRFRWIERTSKIWGWNARARRLDNEDPGRFLFLAIILILSPILGTHIRVHVFHFQSHDYMLQESFHPVEAAEGLWIVPEWRSPPVWSLQTDFSYLYLFTNTTNRTFLKCFVPCWRSWWVNFASLGCERYEHCPESWIGIWNWGTPYYKIMSAAAPWTCTRRGKLIGLWNWFWSSRDCSTQGNWESCRTHFWRTDHSVNMFF